MKMRKLFAGLAAAATLLSGLALTAGSAAADDNVVPTSASWPTTAGTYPVTGTDLTITATDKAQLVGHVFRLYKLADYVYYQKDGDLSKETVKGEVGLQTVGWNKDHSQTSKAYQAVQAAMAEATKGNKTDGKPNDDSYATAWNGENGATETKYRSEDPLAWAAQPKKLDGTDKNPNTLNSNGRIDQSPTNPWTGNTRTFAEAFKASDFEPNTTPSNPAKAFPLAATITATESTDTTTGNITEVKNDAGQVTGYKVTVGSGTGQTSLTRGLYLIVDATEADSKVADKDWSNSLRMVVGTKLELSADGNDKLSDGTIDLKNQTMPVTKEVVKSEQKGKNVVYTPNESPDYNIGETVTYRLTTKIPSYNGYEKNATYPYDDTYQESQQTKNTNRRVLQITDTMSKGLTYDHVESVTVTPTGTGATATSLNEEQKASPDGTKQYSANDYRITKTTKDAQGNNLTYGTDAKHDDAKDEKGSIISSGSATKVTIDLGGYVNQADGASSTGTNDDGSAKSIAEGGTVTVIITATLNKDALVSDSTVAKANPNKVELTYSNNPDDMSSKTTVHGGEANVYTFRFQLEKYAKDSTDPENKIPLDGAKFEIATVENKTETQLVKVTTTNKTDNTSKVEWMTETKVNEMRTKNGGKLPDGVKTQDKFVSGDTNGDGEFHETPVTDNNGTAHSGDKYASAEDKAKGKKVDGYTAGLVGGLEGLQATKYDSTKKQYTPITYKVTETDAPEGYQGTVLPSFTFTITPTYKRDDTTNPNINKDDKSWGVGYLTYKDKETDKNDTVHVSYSADDKDTWSLVDQNEKIGFQYDVQNVKNISQLPKTGAAGIILFGVAGLLLAAAAVTVGLKSRATKRALYA